MRGGLERYQPGLISLVTQVQILLPQPVLLGFRAWRVYLIGAKGAFTSPEERYLKDIWTALYNAIQFMLAAR